MKNNNNTPYFACFLSSLLLPFFGVFGSLFCVITAFDINVNTFALVAACAASSVIFSLFSLFKAEISAPLFICAGGLWVIAIILKAGSFFNGFKSSLSFLMVRYNRFAEFIVPFYDEDELLRYSSESENTCFFVLIAIMLAFILVIAVANDIHFLVPFAITLPCLAACLFIVNTMPSPLPLFSLLSFWVTLVITSVLRRAGRETGAYGIIAALSVLTVLSLTIMGLFPANGYKRPEFVENANKKILRLFDINATVVINHEEHETSTPEESEEKNITDPVGPEELKNVGDRISTGREVMRIYTDRVSKDTLIRGRSLGDYRDSTWEEIPQYYFEAEKDILDLFGLKHPDDFSVYVILENAKSSSSYQNTKFSFQMIVDLLDNVSSVEYRPPFSRRYQEDKYVFYVPGFDITKIKIGDYLSKEESAYSSVVRDHFLQYEHVKSVSDAVDYLNSIGIHEGDELNVIIKAITEYVRNSAVYSLTPGKVPKGYDFTDWFFQNGKGYCVHFATAATLLFRSFGVPARYVTGFIAKAENYDASKGYITVTDKEAHAWVEVYCDGFGWIPVDVTPGYDAGYVPPEESSEVSEEESSYEVSEEKSREEHSKEESSETSVSSEASKESSEITPIIPTSPKHKMKSGVKILIIVLLVLSLSVGGLLINRRVRLNARKKRFEDKDINTAAIHIWKFASSVVRYGGKIDSCRMYEIAEKAKYSRKGINKDEYTELIANTEKSVGELYSSSSFFKRLKLKYIHAVL